MVRLASYPLGITEPGMNRLAEAFMGGLARIDWGWLQRQSFLTEGTGNQRLMHALMRDALQQQEQRDRPEIFAAIHRFLFEQHDAIARVDAIAGVTPAAEYALLQAAHHRRWFDEAGFFGWLGARVPVYRDAARTKMLEILFEDLVAYFGARRPETDSDLLTLRHNLAQQIGHQGRYAEAEAELRAIWEIWRRPEVLGEAHPNTLRTRYSLARMLDAQDRRTEADALLDGLEAQLLASCDEGHRWVQELRAYLAER